MAQADTDLPTLQKSSGEDCKGIVNVRLWWIVILAGVAFRLFLTANDGIIPAAYDSRNYAQNAGHMFSNDNLTIMPSHRPGLSIIAALVTQFGIPYKLYLEFLLCFNAVMAGVLISQLTRSQWLGGILFFVLILNPWFTENSQLFMTEPLISVLMLMQLVFGAQLIVRPIRDWKKWHVIFAGSASLLHVLSRNETLLIFLYWIAIAAVVFIRQRKTIFTTKFLKSFANAKIALLLVPAGMMLVTTEAVKQHNQEKFGVDALCVTEGEGFSNLMQALYTIPPDESIRYAPVTRQSLSLACDHSPTLAKYRELLLDTNRINYKFAKKRLGLDDEFGTWLNWHLFNCISGTKAQVDATMKVAAEEIRRAQSNGQLATRPAMYPASPYTNKWIGEIWAKFLAALNKSLFTEKSNTSGPLRLNRNWKAFDRSLYDEGLLLRNGLANQSEVVITGVLQGPKSNVTHAVVCDREGDLVASVNVETATTSRKTMFNCVLDQTEYIDSNEPLFIYLVNEDNGSLVRTDRVELLFRRYQISVFAFESNDELDDQFPDEKWLVQSHRSSVTWRTRKKIQQEITKDYHWLLIGCWATAFIVGLVIHHPRRRLFDVAWVGIAATVFVAVRSLMYVLICVWLQWGLNRYVEPNHLTFIVGLTCVSFAVGGTLRVLFFQRSTAASEVPQVAD